MAYDSWQEPEYAFTIRDTIFNLGGAIIVDFWKPKTYDFSFFYYFYFSSITLIISLFSQIILIRTFLVVLVFSLCILLIIHADLKLC